MKKETIATLVVFGFIALIIASSIWQATGNGWWTALVAVVGGAVVTAVLRFIFGKAAEKFGG